jgi:hypothetical protein
MSSVENHTHSLDISVSGKRAHNIYGDKEPWVIFDQNEKKAVLRLLQVEEEEQVKEGQNRRLQELED